MLNINICFFLLKILQTSTVLNSKDIEQDIIKIIFINIRKKRIWNFKSNTLILS